MTRENIDGEIYDYFDVLDSRLQVSWMRGGATLVRSDGLPQRELREGEALRWLAESVLIPTALLPESGLVRWKPVPRDDRMLDPRNQAVLEVPVATASEQSGAESPQWLQLLATFDPEDGWLTRVEGIRPMIQGAGEPARYLPWIGLFSSYRWIQPVSQSFEGGNSSGGGEALPGMWIPSHMEAGWNLHADTRVSPAGSDDDANSEEQVNEEEEEVTFFFRGDNIEFSYDISVGEE